MPKPCCQERQTFRRLLLACVPYLKDDVRMNYDISRFSPLPPEDQAKHDATIPRSETLLHEIAVALGDESIERI